MEWNEVFNVYTEFKNDNLEISIFEVRELNEDIQECLDENLITICEGRNSFSDITIIKKRIIKLFDGKNKEWKMGAIAEFFIHLYMNLTGYTQDCLFLNLEENSIKKGFDGYYNFKENHWIMESKSGSILSKDISHKSKLKEAITDLKNKIEGKSKNNPWQEAYNHACHCDVGTPADIRKSIKKLSDEYTLDKFYNIDDFNIIPCATIFLDKFWNPKSKDLLVKEAENAIANTKYKKAHLICVTQASIDIFDQYINTI